MAKIQELYFDVLKRGDAKVEDEGSQGDGLVDKFFEGELTGSWPQGVPLGTHIRDSRDKWLKRALNEPSFAQNLSDGYHEIKVSMEKKTSNLARGISLMNNSMTAQKSGTLKLADIKSYLPGVDNKKFFLVGSAGVKHKVDETPEGLLRLCLASTLSEFVEVAKTGVSALLVTRKGIDTLALGYLLGGGRLDSSMEIYVQSDAGHTSMLIAQTGSAIPKYVLCGSTAQRENRCVWRAGEATSTLALATSSSEETISLGGMPSTMAQAKTIFQDQLVAARDMSLQWGSLSVPCHNLRLACEGGSEHRYCKLQVLKAISVLTGRDVLARRLESFTELGRLVTGLLDMSRDKWQAVERPQYITPMTSLLVYFRDFMQGNLDEYKDCFGDLITNLPAPRRRNIPSGPRPPPVTVPGELEAIDPGGSDQEEEAGEETGAPSPIQEGWRESEPAGGL